MKMNQSSVTEKKEYEEMNISLTTFGKMDVITTSGDFIGTEGEDNVLPSIPFFME